MSGIKEKINMLKDMGFDELRSRKTLQKCHGNVEAALNRLLSNNVVTNSVASSSSVATAKHSNRGQDTTPQIIHGSISQYSFESSRSACTCMALQGAKMFLEKEAVVDKTLSENSGKRSGEKLLLEFINPEFLQLVVLEGHDVYQSLSRISASVEHTSVEEVLQTSAFPSLQIVGDIKQGLLTAKNSKDELNLRRLLRRYIPKIGWTCVVMTKSPETILLLLSSDVVKNQPAFALIDTHPRPHLKASGAYAQVFCNFNDLVRAVETLFPATKLGPGVPEMMATMYNSFDLYQISRKTQE